MGGLRIGVVEWNLLHQNPQLIKLRSLGHRPKEVSGLPMSLWDRIWLRTLNIISGISEFSWNSTQSLTLQTGVVGCRRHRKSSTENQHVMSVLGIEYHRWKYRNGWWPCYRTKETLPATPQHSHQRLSFSQALLTKQRTLNTSNPDRDPVWLLRCCWPRAKLISLFPLQVFSNATWPCHSTPENSEAD